MSDAGRYLAARQRVLGGREVLDALGRICDPRHYPACVPAPLPEGEVVIRVMKVNEEIRLRQALVYQILSES